MMTAQTPACLQGNSMGYPLSAHMQRSQLHGGGPAGGVKRRADADPFGGSHEPMKQQRVQQPYTAQVRCCMLHVAGALCMAQRVAAQGKATTLLMVVDGLCIHMAVVEAGVSCHDTGLHTLYMPSGSVPRLCDRAAPNGSYMGNGWWGPQQAQAAMLLRWTLLSDRPQGAI